MLLLLHLLKDANNNKFATLSWMASYNILDKMGVSPPGEQEYELDCVDDPPSGKTPLLLINNNLQIKWVNLRLLSQQW